MCFAPKRLIRVVLFRPKEASICRRSYYAISVCANGVTIIRGDVFGVGRSAGWSKPEFAAVDEALGATNIDIEVSHARQTVDSCGRDHFRARCGSESVAEAILRGAAMAGLAIDV